MKNLIMVVFLIFISVFVTEGSLRQLPKEKKSVEETRSKAVKSNQFAPLNVAEFDKDNSLLIPKGYREWVFVGSSLGLSYRETLTQTEQPTMDLYHFTYIHPKAYQQFSKTGKFPEGTVLVLELLTKEEKKEPGLQGSYGKEYAALEVSVKDSKRFKDGWAYFSFDGEDGKPLTKAQAFPSQSCFVCHDKKAEIDHVFTQFYPVLRAAKPN